MSEDPSLAMKYCGPCHEIGRTDRIRWICPKVHQEKSQYVCTCGNPFRLQKKGELLIHMKIRVFTCFKAYKVILTKEMGFIKFVLLLKESLTILQLLAHIICAC